jgi:fumarate reductase flavoprotein subunit
MMTTSSSTTPATLEPWDGRAFEVEVPVLVVGGGACGLTAALAARDGGAEVLVAEQGPRCAGSSSMSLGALCAAGTREQARHGVEDDAAAFLADIMAKTRGQADPELAALVAQESGPALDWLAERYEVAFLFDAGWRPAFGHSRARLHAAPGRTGADMMSRLAAACARAEVDILNDAQAVALFATEAGEVKGVRLRRPDESLEEIGCGALVLATCGFGGNAEMVASHIPSMAEARYFGWEANTGDGLAWGQALGGELADMDAYQGLGLLADPQGIDVNPKLLIEGGVQVNARGERFSDELDDVSGQGARVIAQPGGYSWVIYDARVHQACADRPQSGALLELNARRSAGSVAELAQAIGAPAAALEATLATVSEAVRGGRPDSFGRRFDRPELRAPYHALRVTGALFHTQGGLKVDAAARVVRPGGGALPNLYAGGGAARGISGRGPSGYLPGAGLCSAVTLGRIAGRAAARQVQASGAYTDGGWG